MVAKIWFSDSWHIALGQLDLRLLVVDLASMITEGPLGYLLIYIATVAGAFGCPVPEDVAVITSGFLYYIGQFSLVGALAIGIAGVLSGDVVVYTYGRVFHTISDGRHPRLKRFIERMIGCGTREKFERLFHKHGNKMIFAARFVPGLRFATFFSAGAAGTKFAVFFLYDFLASLISVPIWLWLGWYFGEDLAFLVHKIETTEAALGKVILGLGLVLAGWFGVKRLIRHFRPSCSMSAVPVNKAKYKVRKRPSASMFKVPGVKSVARLLSFPVLRSRRMTKASKAAVVRFVSKEERERVRDRMVS